MIKVTVRPRALIDAWAAMLVDIERERHANSPSTSAPVGTTIQKEIGALFK